MRYAILGGDMRFAHLAGILTESGRPAEGFLQDAAGGKLLSLAELKNYSCIISNWPVRWPLSLAETSEEEIMENISPGSVLLLCGPKFPASRRWDLQYINLWEDEKLLQENAYLTAEGAVAAAMQRCKSALLGLNCAVVGYGRIGRALTEILINIGARVTVVSGRESKLRLAAESGAKTALIEELNTVLPQQRLVFSTPPAQVIGRELLERVHPDAILIDLASPPYGIDLDAAQEMNLHAYRESGIPGRYCPLSAARAVYNAVLRWEEAELHEI